MNINVWLHLSLFLLFGALSIASLYNLMSEDDLPSLIDAEILYLDTSISESLRRDIDNLSGNNQGKIRDISVMTSTKKNKNQPQLWNAIKRRVAKWQDIHNENISNNTESNFGMDLYPNNFMKVDIQDYGHNIILIPSTYSNRFKKVFKKLTRIFQHNLIYSKISTSGNSKFQNSLENIETELLNLNEYLNNKTSEFFTIDECTVERKSQCILRVDKDYRYVYLFVLTRNGYSNKNLSGATSDNENKSTMRIYRKSLREVLAFSTIKLLTSSISNDPSIFPPNIITELISYNTMNYPNRNYNQTAPFTRFLWDLYVSEADEHFFQQYRELEYSYLKKFKNSNYSELRKYTNYRDSKSGIFENSKILLKNESIAFESVDNFLRKLSFICKSRKYSPACDILLNIESQNLNNKKIFDEDISKLFNDIEQKSSNIIVSISAWLARFSDEDLLKIHEDKTVKIMYQNYLNTKIQLRLLLYLFERRNSNLEVGNSGRLKFLFKDIMSLYQWMMRFFWSYQELAKSLILYNYTICENIFLKLIYRLKRSFITRIYKWLVYLSDLSIYDDVISEFEQSIVLSNSFYNRCTTSIKIFENKIMAICPIYYGNNEQTSGIYQDYVKCFPSNWLIQLSNFKLYEGLSIKILRYLGWVLNLNYFLRWTHKGIGRHIRFDISSESDSIKTGSDYNNNPVVLLYDLIYFLSRSKCNNNKKWEMIMERSIKSQQVTMYVDKSTLTTAIVYRKIVDQSAQWFLSIYNIYNEKGEINNGTHLNNHMLFRFPGNTDVTAFSMGSRRIYYSRHSDIFTFRRTVTYDMLRDIYEKSLRNTTCRNTNGILIEEESCLVPELPIETDGPKVNRSNSFSSDIILLQSFNFSSKIGASSINTKSPDIPNSSIKNELLDQESVLVVQIESNKVGLVHHIKTFHLDESKSSTNTVWYESSPLIRHMFIFPKSISTDKLQFIEYSDNCEDLSSCLYTKSKNRVYSANDDRVVRYPLLDITKDFSYIIYAYLFFIGAVNLKGNTNTKSKPFIELSQANFNTSQYDAILKDSKISRVFDKYWSYTKDLSSIAISHDGRAVAMITEHRRLFVQIQRQNRWMQPYELKPIPYEYQDLSKSSAIKRRIIDVSFLPINSFGRDYCRNITDKWSNPIYLLVLYEGGHLSLMRIRPQRTGWFWIDLGYEYRIILMQVLFYTCLIFWDRLKKCLNSDEAERCETGNLENTNNRIID
ncbi:hypothetical protein cand_017310 [Cryptosporidium andersoni]|uniref:Uncharacterized protein n=1 Tax=Cryptosporidium andersoni TaxID=117008 RepID=A0A1J4MTE4_9CRYT|nr:hypothetical protein cand_017310 [Cryptosporidium andersoni]